MVATRNITDLNTLVTPAADDILLIVDRLSATSTEAKQITWANVQEAIQDIVGALATDTTTIDFVYDDANGQLTAAVKNNSSIQKSIFHDGTTSSTRQEGRFVDGAGINVVVADDSANDRANITVNNTGVVNAENSGVTGTHYDLISSVTVQADGSKTLTMRPLKIGSNQISATLTDSNQSLTLDLVPGNINLNDLNSSTPLGVSTGGTGASTAANARVNLGAAKSGSNSDITAISGLTTALSIAQGGTGATTASAALAALVGLNSVAHVGAAGESLVQNGQRLVSGAYRAELKGIKPASGNLTTVTTDGSDVAVGANPNNILDAVTGVRNLNGARLTGAATPIVDSDLATRGYVDSVAQGLDVKEAVRVASTGNLAGTYNASGQTLTANSNGAISIDGVALSAADRVLLKDQSTQTQNGIYTVTTVGDGSNAFVLTRAADFNQTSEIGAGAFMFVSEGSTNASKSFIQTATTPTLDSNNLTFVVFGDTSIANDSINNAKLANQAQATVKGRAAGTGTGDPTDLTADQVVGVINTSTSTFDSSLLPATANTNARVEVSNAGSSVGTRREINFIAGTNVSLSVSDNSSDERVDVTINSSQAAAGVSLGLALALG